MASAVDRQVVRTWLHGHTTVSTCAGVPETELDHAMREAFTLITDANPPSRCSVSGLSHRPYPPWSAPIAIAKGRVGLKRQSLVELRLLAAWNAPAGLAGFCFD
ncbi:hypothetical protein D0T12_33220 [Actinomadura spongiicola]|uniref:Uncharacterized protein n=1 Tax=Actinomadura spongiicola TaxID=2303421 RepID=A0A372G761_9ACTN|nr:hypothetical protein [Actinomadura spongiicola]RFS81234.1 hypothetical protein D0T12_33220 [Actinomadura spongiicola]